MKKTEIENYKKYHTPGCQNYIKRPKNAIFISPANSIEHELTKALICYDIKKQGHIFITEAVPNNRKSRRIDIVDLTNGEEIEIETNKRVFKVGSKTYYIQKRDYGWDIVEKDKWDKYIGEEDD